MAERCHTCDQLTPTTEKWERGRDVENMHLCWQPEGSDCWAHKVDWRARALVAEAVAEAAVYRRDPDVECAICGAWQPGCKADCPLLVYQHSPERAARKEA
jgi:hypothetical protein